MVLAGVFLTLGWLEGVAEEVEEEGEQRGRGPLEASFSLSARFFRDLGGGRAVKSLARGLEVLEVGVSCFGDFGLEGRSKGSSSSYLLTSSLLLAGEDGVSAALLAGDTSSSRSA